jgi:hypothetical protein
VTATTHWILPLASAPSGIGPVLEFVGGGHYLTAANIGLRAQLLYGAARRGAHSHERLVPPIMRRIDRFQGD